jgi:hypothetical protein
MKNDRTSFKKGTPENAMLKLALNGAYGKSLSEHSVLYDPKFGLTVTINGQLFCLQRTVIVNGDIVVHIPDYHSLINCFL